VGRLRSGFPGQPPQRVPKRAARIGAFGPVLPTGQDSPKPGRLPARVHFRAADRSAEVAMTGNRWVRRGIVAALVVALVGGIYLLWPGRGGHKVVGYFTSAVGLYPGDSVRVVGVPVGSIESIEPRADAVKITMTVKNGVKVPADARAVIVS